MIAAAESAEPQAATRVLRTITVVLGFGGGVFFALTVAQMVAEADYVATAWQIVASLLMFAVPLVLAIACHLLPFAAIQRALGVYALGFILVVATWLPAMTRHPMPLDLSPWPLGATMLGVVSAALAFPPALAWAAIALNVGLVGLVRYQASGGANLEIALQDTIFTVAFALAFVALAMVAVRGGHAQDAAAGLARAGAARAAYTAARVREEVRLDALVHDEIMTALYYASQDRPELAASIRAQAARALAELSEMMDARAPDHAPVAPAAFVGRLRAVILDLAPRAQFQARGERSEPIPADVAAAFAEAAAEAVRNSVTHAGARGVTRTASVLFEPGAITVAINDDGEGFDARFVRPRRLGMMVSIRARLETIPGGSAAVTSSRGHGTLVLLAWRAP